MSNPMNITEKCFSTLQQTPVNSRDTSLSLTARAHPVLQWPRPTETGEQADWLGDKPLPVVCRCFSHCHTARTAGRGFNHAPSVCTRCAEGDAASAWCVVTWSPWLQRQRPSCPWGRAQRGAPPTLWPVSYMSAPSGLCPLWVWCGCPTASSRCRHSGWVD